MVRHAGPVKDRACMQSLLACMHGLHDTPHVSMWISPERTTTTNTSTPMTIAACAHHFTELDDARVQRIHQLACDRATGRLLHLGQPQPERVVDPAQQLALRHEVMGIHSGGSPRYTAPCACSNFARRGGSDAVSHARVRGRRAGPVCELSPRRAVATAADPPERSCVERLCPLHGRNDAARCAPCASPPEPAPRSHAARRLHAASTLDGHARRGAAASQDSACGDCAGTAAPALVNHGSHLREGKGSRCWSRRANRYAAQLGRVARRGPRRVHDARRGCGGAAHRCGASAVGLPSGRGQGGQGGAAQSATVRRCVRRGASSRRPVSMQAAGGGRWDEQWRG
eukprot:359260-Chlamydomonas_euryale.AAC.7